VHYQTIIFKGIHDSYTLIVHVNAGNPYLSGSAACHWYFNPDIPEAAPYYDRYIALTCTNFDLI
jgi:hypothetical protein